MMTQSSVIGLKRISDMAIGSGAILFRSRTHQ
jgi:hypothetical protein